MSAITRRLREDNEALRKRVAELEVAYLDLVAVRIDELAAAILHRASVARKLP
jgi:hypothetical protein